MTTVRIEVNGKAICINLDEEKFTQQMMLETLSAGKFYEPPTSLAILESLHEGDTFVDVGAHIGYFSMLASTRVGETGKVFAFEPESENLLHMQITAHENKCLVHACWCAVGEIPLPAVKFYTNLDNDGGHSIWDPGKHPFNILSKASPRRITVRQVTLDEALHAHEGDIQVLKIDVEGSEWNVLKGAEQLLASGRVKNVILEINDFALEQMGASEAKIRETMRRHNYRTQLLETWPAVAMADDQTYKPETNSVYNLLFTLQN